MANRIHVVTLLAISAVVTMAAVAAGQPQASGIVLDRDTKQPVADAYVLATYYVVLEGSFVVATKCVKNMGMYTLADGKYSFPLERTNGTSPGLIIAIKPDYESGVFEPAHKTTERSRRPADFFDSVILLRRQDPSNPDFHFGSSDEECVDAPTPKDAAAGTEWLRIELKERAKYGFPKPQVELLRKTIKEREAREGTVK